MVELLAEPVTLALAVAFALAATGKLQDRRFASNAFLSGSAASLALPVAELYLSGMLLFCPYIWLSALLVTIFLIPATFYLLTLGRGRPCSCFGTQHRMPWGLSILRNLVLLSGALYLASTATHGINFDARSIAGSLAVGTLLSTGLAGAYIGGWMILCSAWALTTSSPFAAQGSERKETTR